MKSLSDIILSNSKQLYRSLILISTTILLIFLYFSFNQVLNKQNQVNSLLKNLFEHNSMVPLEEERNIEQMKAFNNIFTISYTHKDNADFCSVRNCYKVSYFNQYIDIAKGVLIYFIFILLINTMFRMNSSMEGRILYDELNKLNILLAGDVPNSQAKFQSREVNNLLKLLKEREKSLDFILNARNFAHDLRSPLSALDTISSEENLPEEVRKVLKMAVERIEEILSTVLNSSNNIRQEKINIRSFLISIIKEKQFEYKNFKFQFKLIDEINIDTYILFNKLDLNRIFSNIINNSFDATKQKGNLEIILSQTEQTVLVSLSDDGPGFPQILMNNGILEGRSDKEDGNGLGLSHAKHSLHNHNAEIRLTNTKNGSRVELVFPKYI